jgi:hypothetical protein
LAAALLVAAALAASAYGCNGGGSKDGTDTPSAESTASPSAGSPTPGSPTIPTATQGPITPIFPNDTPGPTSSPTPQPPRTVQGAPKASIEEQHIVVTLNQIDDPWEPGAATGPAEGKRFVVFLISVKNNGDFPLALFASHFSLEDADGVSYEETPAAGSDPRLFYEAVEPGQEVKASIAYEVNEGAAIHLLSYRPRVPAANEIGFTFP